jgi:hypothetical protein
VGVLKQSFRLKKIKSKADMKNKHLRTSECQYVKSYQEPAIFSGLIRLILSVVFTFFSVIGMAAEQTSNIDCPMAINNLQSKNSNLDSALISMASLLGSKGPVDVPLTVLFQVNLEDEESVKKRISELSKLTNRAEILKQEEYKDYSECAKDEKSMNLVSQAAEKQAALNTKRLLFLKTERSERGNLIATFEAARQKDLDSYQIEKQLAESKESLGQAQAGLITSEKSISKESDFSGDELLSARSLLEKFVVDIETEHIGFLENIKTERKKLDELRDQLSRHASLDLSGKKIDSQFDTVDTIWRSAAKLLLTAFTKLDVTSDFALPKPLVDPKNKHGNKKEFQNYIELHLKAKQRLGELSEQRQKLLFDFRAINFRLVSDSGRLRAQLIKLCETSSSCENIGSLNENTITGVATEVRLLPLKLLGGSVNKIVEFKAKWNRGFEGWVDIARQIMILIGLMLLPILAHKLLKLTAEKLDQLRKQVLARSILDYKQRTRLALWISRLNPFVPSLGMVASIHIARVLIEETDLAEFSLVIFYLEIYFLYKAVRLVLRILIELIFSSEILELNSDLSQRAEDTARRLSRFFFARFVLLHIVEDTLRRALVFGIVYEISTWASLFVVVNEVRFWKSEILQAFQVRFPKARSHFKKITERRLGLGVLAIFFIFVLVHDVLKWSSLYLIRFNFFKRLFSEVLRKKLEQEFDFSKTLQTPDSKYLSVFDYYLPAEKHFYIDREPLVAKDILNTINSWLNDQSPEDLVVLVGSRGIGKSTSVKMIFDQINSNDKFFVWVSPKIYSCERLLDWLSKHLGVQINSIEDFIRVESTLDKKIVIMVDDIHNLFVGKIGGFQAYRLFMEIISLKTTKIFWCLTANSHAWTYLKGVFGDEHFYGQVYEMRMWTDSEIQNLILARHKVTGYSRSFDKSISAYGTGDILGEKVETQFFRLLWGQSRGNPRSALMYWLSAVSQTDDSGIHVGVPKFINSAAVSNMSKDALLVLAAIAKHDSLTIDELMDVTRINKLVIRKIIKESSEKELVWTDKEDRIRISSRAQNAIDYYLVGKNFLYE